MMLFACDTDRESSIDRHSLTLVQHLQNNKNELVANALQIAGEEPVTVNLQKKTGFDIEPGTYVSLACYWWPDQNKPDGLPYIRKDGEVNPETRSDESDLPALIEMVNRVEILSLAYYVTGDEFFAGHAIKQLASWFIDSETAMLPHLEHAQMIRGTDQGRSYGVIDTWWLVRIVDSFEYLSGSEHWSAEVEQGLRHWFTHYLNWLRNSEFGRQEMRSRNNHGTWYDVQVLTYSIFVDQPEFAAFYLEAITQKRMNRQVTFSGRQKYETRRPRPEHYSIYNLSGWMRLVNYAEKLDVDLLNRQTFLNPGIRGAIHYLVEMMQNSGFEQILDPLDLTDSDRLYLDLLIQASRMYDDPLFVNEIHRIAPDVSNAGRVFLKYSDPQSSDE